MTESERNELLGTRQHPEISRFLENIQYRRFGNVAPLSDDEKAALTADICITVDRLYEAKEDNATDDSTQQRFQLRQGARKKRVVHGVLAEPPSGAPSLCLTPFQTDSQPQCVQDCVRLLRLTSSKPVHLVSDVPNAMDGFLKPSKWGWDGLDISRLTNCIENLIQLAKPTRTGADTASGSLPVAYALPPTSDHTLLAPL